MATPMKIVHINFGLETGGIETMLVDILNEQCAYATVYLLLINEQIDVNLIATIDPRVVILRIGRPKGSRNPLYITKLNAALLRLKPDVVHCHNHQIARLLWGRTGRRYLTIHDVQVPTSYFGRYDKLFAISDIVRQDVLQRTGLDAYRIYNGIRTEAIVARTAYTANEIFRIVQISRLQHNKKGQHILLNALRELVYTYQLTHLRVEFVGEGESRTYLQQLTNDLGLNNYVTFAGLKTRADLYQELQNYHLLVQPSLYEGFGLTVAEGMAAGVPVLVSAIDGPMELIDNDRFGYSFPSGDAHQLAERIRGLVLDYESKAVRTMATSARQHACTTFDVRQTASRYLASY
ncbi:glycosyltransferase [Spirosoma endbachense]|uniref:Glycosyltransferase n=2 Tax=Spirosoma endbachense TaxID=2666025 RepID=A0A6P1VQT3_9BACT|nr:glycosyltransferase [Spirosoma endbachense]